MSCNTCKKIDTSNYHGLQYSLHINILSVKGYKITSPLFIPAKAPRGGWYFTLYIKGHEFRVKKNKPHEVAAEVARLLDLNEILYTRTQLWLNLNIQWVGRAVDKYQMVKLPDLLAISTPNF